MNGSTVSSRRKRWAILASAALAAGAVGAVPASATQSGNGVRPGSNITVFHNIDFVAVFGYGPVGRPVSVRVFRRGVLIGSARGPAIDAEGLPGLEVNHGPEGAARPGDCWEGHTPDIRPGDVIRVTDARGTDQVTVDNIGFTGQPTEDGLLGGGDITVPFTARLANGDAVPIARLDSAEFRAGSDLRFEATDIELEAAPGGGPGEYQMRYTAPFSPSRNREALNQQQIRDLLLGDGHAIGFGHTDPLPRESMLHDGLEDTPGPAPGCESAPNAQHAVTVLTPQVINGSTPANRTVSVQGFSNSATEVVARMRDANGTTETAPATLRGATDLQTWSAVFTAAQIRRLNGLIRVTALVDGAPAGASRTLLKDTVDPRRPGVSLRSGRYRGTQVVTLRTGPGNTIRYRLGRPGATTAPRRNTGKVYRGEQIRIRRSRTLKMIAIDQAGNVSPVARHRYRIIRRR
ncbi:MAG: chitobiase/beta-hexosaminidase C-terminal domain-containing protein [Nocardioidaceae bacterium]